MEKKTTLNLDDHQEINAMNETVYRDIEAQYKRIAPHAKRLFKNEISYEEYKKLFKFRVLKL